MQTKRRRITYTWKCQETSKSIVPNVPKNKTSAIEPCGTDNQETRTVSWTMATISLPQHFRKIKISKSKCWYYFLGLFSTAIYGTEKSAKSNVQVIEVSSKKGDNQDFKETGTRRVWKYSEMQKIFRSNCERHTWYNVWAIPVTRNTHVVPWRFLVEQYNVSLF